MYTFNQRVSPCYDVTYSTCNFSEILWESVLKYERQFIFSRASSGLPALNASDISWMAFSYRLSISSRISVSSFWLLLPSILSWYSITSCWYWQCEGAYSAPYSMSCLLVYLHEELWISYSSLLIFIARVEQVSCSSKRVFQYIICSVYTWGLRCCNCLLALLGRS